MSRKPVQLTGIGDLINIAIEHSRLVGIAVGAEAVYIFHGFIVFGFIHFAVVAFADRAVSLAVAGSCLVVRGFGGVGLSNDSVTAGVCCNVLCAVVGERIVRSNTAVGADGPDGDIVLVGDAGGRILHGEHGFLAVHHAPVACARVQNFCQGGNVDGDAVGEGCAHGLTLSQSQFDGSIIGVDIMCSTGNAAAADGHDTAIKGKHTGSFAADGAADDRHGTIIGKHTGCFAADRAAADCHGTIGGIHTVFVAAADGAADDGAAADCHGTVRGNHTLVFAADGAAFLAIGDDHFGILDVQAVVSARQRLSVQVQGEHAGGNELVVVAQVDVLQQLYLCVVPCGAAAHRLDGFVQGFIIGGGAANRDGGCGQFCTAGALAGGAVHGVGFGGFRTAAGISAGMGAVLIDLVGQIAGMLRLGFGSVCIVGINRVNILGAGKIAIVDLIAAQDRMLVGADILAPDLAGLAALEQVSHFAGGELGLRHAGGNTFHIRGGTARRCMADTKLKGGAICSAAGQVIRSFDRTCILAHHAADIPAGVEDGAGRANVIAVFHGGTGVVFAHHAADDACTGNGA